MGEVFSTDLGRKVYGGGGITPDVASTLDVAPDFIQFLRARAAFLNFAVDYLRESPVNTKSWQPDDAVFEKLRTWLKQESIGTPEEIDEAFADAATRKAALSEVQIEVMTAAFGVTEGHRVRSRIDNQLQKALSLFDDARELLETREAIKATKKSPQVATSGSAGAALQERAELARPPLLKLGAEDGAVVLVARPPLCEQLWRRGRRIPVRRPG